MRPRDLLARLAEESNPSDTDFDSSDSASGTMFFNDSRKSVSNCTIAPNFPGEQRETDQVGLNARAGQYWVVEKDGEECPVIVCDEEIVQCHFKEICPEIVHPQNDILNTAMRSGGSYTGKKVYACLYASSLECDWILYDKLIPFTIPFARDMGKKTTNATLACAWQEVIERYTRSGDTGDLGYWKDKIIARKYEKECIVASATRRAPKLGSRYQSFTDQPKRKRSRNQPYPAYIPEEEVDDEESDSFLTSSSYDGTKIKREFGGVDEDNSFLHGLTPLHSTVSSKRRSHDMTRCSTVRLGTPFGGYHNKLATPKHRPSRINPKTRDYTGEYDMDPEIVQIFVGDPHRIYKVRRQGLNASPLLSRLLVNNADSGYYVMSPMLSSLDADAFFPIAEYLEREEYSPNILDDGTDWVRFEANLTSEEHGQEIVRSSTIYNLAKTLEMCDLQDLAFRKLKALVGFDESFPFIAILTVVEHVFEDANDDMRQFLIQFIADTYWPLIVSETMKTVEIMQGSQDLANGVFTRLSNLTSSRGSVKREEEEKLVDGMQSDIKVKQEDDKEYIINHVQKAEMQKAVEASEIEKTKEDMDLQKALQASLQEQYSEFLDSTEPS